MSTSPPNPTKSQSPVSLRRLDFNATVCGIDISPGGVMLAAGLANGFVDVRRLDDGARVFGWQFNLEGDQYRARCVSAVAFSRNSEWLAAAAIMKGGVGVWNLPSKTRVFYEHFYSSVNCLAFSPGDNSLAFGMNNREIRIVSIPAGELLHGWSIPGNYINCVDSIAFSPDGKLIAAGSTDGYVRVWDVADISVVVEERAHRSSVVGLAFSSDGELLLSASADRSVQVTNTRSWVTEGREEFGGIGVRAAAWGPRGSFWAARTSGYTGHRLKRWSSASYSGVVALTGVRPWGRLYEIPQHSSQLEGMWPTRALAIGRDGKRLVTYTPYSLSALEVWDISELPKQAAPRRAPQREPLRARARAVHVAPAVRQHLATLPLAHTQPPTPPRPALWLRGAASVGARLPLFLAQDLGTILTRPGTQSALARPDHLPAELNTLVYTTFLRRVAGLPLLREVSSWDISDAMVGVVLARSVTGVEFPQEYALPVGPELVELTRVLGKELDRADPARIWDGPDAPARPSLSALLTPDALARIETNLRALGADELRFLHQYGPRFAGAPDPRSLLDLFSLLDMPPAVRLALSQMLRLLPRVSQSAKAGSVQTYSVGGYAGLTRTGNLDNLVPTELAHSQVILLHRLMNREALYYGREAERERRRELAYIVTQAGLELLGDGEVVARALTLALAQTMARRGYVVEQSFVGSTWTPPAEMSNPSDVQRVLYYRDGGWLRPDEMLSAVSERLRTDAERYRSMQVMWVVSEFWDADGWAEREQLYAALRQRAEQQVWVVRVGDGRARRGRDCPPAVRQLGRCEIVNSDLLWAESRPPERIYVEPQPKASGGWEGLRDRIERGGFVGTAHDVLNFAGGVQQLTAWRELARLDDHPEQAKIDDYLHSLTPAGMVYVPAGTFLMGSASDDNQADQIERPQHELRLAGYYIGTYPVTVSEYQKFIEAGGYQNPNYWTTDGWDEKERSGWRAPELWGRSERSDPVQPAISMSWYEAVAYCRWRGVRLPTEAEWEKAASWDAVARHKRRYPWGDDWDANKCVIGKTILTTGPRRVGLNGEDVSPYGVRDMCGNIWEYCSSRQSDDRKAPYSYPYRADDGREDLSGEPEIRVVIKGLGNTSAIPRIWGRCAYRGRIPRNHRYAYMGFRCAAPVLPDVVGQSSDLEVEPGRGAA